MSLKRWVGGFFSMSQDVGRAASVSGKTCLESVWLQALFAQEHFRGMQIPEGLLTV